MYLHMSSEKESNENPFDPCGETSPDGCSACPNNSECYPDLDFREISNFGDVDPDKIVLEAWVTFQLENGETLVMDLDTFLENTGFFVEDDLRHSLDPIYKRGLSHPMTITDGDGNSVEIDHIGSRLELGTPQELEDLRNVEQMIRTENLGDDVIRFEEF